MTHTDRKDFARPVPMADLVSELISDAEETVRAASEGRARGPITGMPELDAAVGGYLNPGLHVFTGDPGSGKTAVALRISSSCMCPAIYVTAEQAPLVLFRRHVARVTETPIDELKRATPQRVRELALRAAAAAPMVLFLDARSGPAPERQIEGLAIKLREQFGARDILLAVDSLQLWARGLGEGDEYALTQAGLKSLVSVAGNLRAPVLVLSHRNRAAARDKNPGMIAAKGSADFEHLAETVIHLSHDDDGQADGFQLDRERQINAFVAKNRHGDAYFSLSFTFDKWTQDFR